MTNTAYPRINCGPVLGGYFLTMPGRTITPEEITTAQNMVGNVFDLGMECIVANMPTWRTSEEDLGRTAITVIQTQGNEPASTMGEIALSLPVAIDLPKEDQVVSQDLESLLLDPRWADHPCCIQLGWLLDEGEEDSSEGHYVLEIFRAE